ncbi:spliceosome-related protein [Ceraceosorus bombacis]|uniref:Spliceosome-related protein n=1 Tax=Ceraceosorus bombacis TaxID=401625 RepID=A0A0P1BCC7_9BASI|nr:spliceosome-related protein [Ceraceosorus bombacis]
MPVASPSSSQESSRSPTPERHTRKRSRSLSGRSDDRSRSPERRRRRRSSASLSPARNGHLKSAADKSLPTKQISNGDGEDVAAANRLEAKGADLRTQLAKLAPTRAGGAYIPPARLKALMAEAAAADSGSVEYQRMSWDALKKSITGLVNKVAEDNIKHIVPELFGGANLIRGRGLFCRSIMKAQQLSLVYTPTFAALAAIVNTKLPMIGELLVTRLVSQFRRSFKRNDKPVCSATATFLAHLVNQRVVHEVLALEILVLLLERPTDDSVEIAVTFMREVGAFLIEESPKATNSIFDRFRAVLYEGDVGKRVQYMIEVLSQVRRDRFKDNPRVPEALDLVEEDDQITHRTSLEDELNVQEVLNIFKPDSDFVSNEQAYQEIKAEILGENSDSEGSDGSDSENEVDGDGEDGRADMEALEIQDQTATNLTNLRRTIYLTIMSSASFQEAVHKLLKLQLPEGQESELCNMIIECCSQERTYNKFYGHIGERLSKLNRVWSGCFEQCFKTYFDSIHRYETNPLRNIARFFGHLLASDSISWASFEIVHMNEDDTTSSSRIFIKILFQEMIEKLGQKKLVERFKHPDMQLYFTNIFPRDNPKNTRFSINYFTAIGLGPLTEDMRAYLKDVPRLLAEQAAAAKAARGAAGSDDSSSDSDSDSSSVLSSSSDDSSSISSSSRSRSPPSRRRRRSSTPPRRRRSPSYSSDDSRAPRRSYRRRSPSYSSADSRAPPRRRDAYSPARSPRRRSSYSPLPPPRRRNSYSRSPSPLQASRRRDSYSTSPRPATRRRDSYSASPPPPSRSRRRVSYSRSPSPGDRYRDQRRRDDYSASPPRSCTYRD